MTCIGTPEKPNGKGRSEPVSFLLFAIEHLHQLRELTLNDMNFDPACYRAGLGTHHLI